MKELSITVIWEGRDDASYRFDQYPVLIGRSPECQLCILHEAVPREVCLAWLENDGKTVRLEERPGLTNLLLKGKNVINGGLSDNRIEVSIGPVKLRFEPGLEKAHKDVKIISRSKIVYISLAGMILLSSLVLLGLKTKVDGRPKGPHLLPASPFCAPVQIPCEDESSCKERARLNVSRARELLSRPQKKPGDRVRAARMLAGASQIYDKSGSPEAAALRAEAEEAIMSVRIAYQNDSMILRRTYRSRESPSEATVKAAIRVIEYLDGCQGPWIPWLKEIAGLSLDNRSKQNDDQTM